MLKTFPGSYGGLWEKIRANYTQTKSIYVYLFTFSLRTCPLLCLRKLIQWQRHGSTAFISEAVVLRHAFVGVTLGKTIHNWQPDCSNQVCCLTQCQISPSAFYTKWPYCAIEQYSYHASLSAILCPPVMVYFQHYCVPIRYSFTTIFNCSYISFVCTPLIKLTNYQNFPGR